MGSPITWQNVNRPDSRVISQLMEGAQRGISGGFDKLGQVIADREAVNQGVADRARNAAEQDYLNGLYGYKTPEELQAARMSGVLDQRLTALDPRNQATARAALDSRTATVQKQTTANDAFAVEQLKQPMVLADTTAMVENAPITRELARNSLLSRQAVEPITQATALTTAKNTQNTANLTSTLASITNANTTKEAAIKGTELAVRGTDAVNQQQDQLLAAETAKAAQAYQDQQSAGRTKLGVLAKGMGFPVDTAGSPDIGNMTKEQRLKLDVAAIQAGHTQTSSTLFAGDTKAAEGFLALQRKNPLITSEAITRNLSKITGAFDSSKNGLPVGNDALTLATNRAQADVVQKEKDQRNRFAPGSQDALNTYEEIAKEIDPMFGANEREDLPHVQALLQKLSTKGIEVAPGQFIVPSKQDVLAAVRSTYEGWNVRNRGRAEDIEKEVKKSLSGSDVTQLLKDAEESRRANRARDVRSILNPLAPAMQPLNPLQLPPPDPKRR